MSKDIPSEGKAKVLLFRRDFFAFWDCCIQYNDTSVIRGPVIKKTGWLRGQWSGANPTPDCFPFSGGAGGKLRETIQNLFQTPFEGNHGRRFYISAKRSTQMNRKTTKKVDE